MADKERTIISVPEMGKWLGLGKTESYWLVKKQYFKVVTVGVNPKTRKMRVLLDSFEKWYAGQTHYKKVTEEPPIGDTYHHKKRRGKDV